MHILDKWDEGRHPEYDFESSKLVYRDPAGNELKRLPFAGNAVADAQALPAPAA